MTPIPLQINEAGTGALTFMLVFAAGYMLDYLARTWQNRPDGVSFEVFRSYTNKAAIGLFTMFVGFTIKSVTTWISLHMVLHREQSVTQLPLTILYIAGTALSLWGLVCTVRAISPYEWRRWTWAWLALGSILVGIMLAM